MSARAHNYLRQNVLGLIAIFIALTGTAVALPGKNKVDSGDIKAGQVKNSDLADNSVTSPKVADGTLQSNDFAAGELPAGTQGPQGPAGPQGPQGEQGPAGSPDTGAQILGKLAGVDGSGSGLDADQLDGLSSSAFALGSHDHDAAYVNEGQGDSATAAMIVNAQRAISIPLTTFIDCDTTPAGADFLDFFNGGDEDPDFVFSTIDGGSTRIRYDDDSDSDQGTRICSPVTVPPDYAGGNVIVRIRAGATTNNGAPAEAVGASLAVDGGAPGVFSSSNSVNTTVGSDDVEFGPVAVDQVLTIAVSAGAVSGVMNDEIDIYGVEFIYNSVQ